MGTDGHVSKTSIIRKVSFIYFIDSQLLSFFFIWKPSHWLGVQCCSFSSFTFYTLALCRFPTDKRGVRIWDQHEWNGYWDLLVFTECAIFSKISPTNIVYPIYNYIIICYQPINCNSLSLVTKAHSMIYIYLYIYTG